jgi:hypothetical protein
METGSTLTNKNIAGFRDFAAEQFYTKTFTFTVPAVICTTYTFFMCHDSKQG